MARSSVMSSKGQVTVPQEIRVRLGLKEGDRVEFVVEGGDTVVRRARTEKNPFEAYDGVLEGAFRGGIPEINAWVDEMRRDEPPSRRRRQRSRR
jgi:AbrB family looped-hinge helix DNA binding protein